MFYCSYHNRPLGALQRIYEVNPLDYCFQALSTKMVPLEEEHGEYKLVKQYISASYELQDKEFIKQIFAVERRGEAERISQWRHLKNKMLLWHGSKLVNFMGILSQGLRIAPVEAFTTGEMFGKGIYFGDTFQKSFGYTGYGGTGEKGYAVLLLCEVALGDMLELKHGQNIKELDAPYKSVKGLGQSGPNPDHKLVMPNGCVVPLGKMMDYYENDTNWMNRPSLGLNEYIVYDISQVRIRYLVMVTIYFD